MERSSSAAAGTAAPAGPADHLDSDPRGADSAPARSDAAGRESAEAAAGLPGTAHAWRALGGDIALLDRISCTVRAVLPARLPVRELARASVAVCSLAAAELSSVRSEGAAGAGSAGAPAGAGPVVPAVSVDDGAVAAAFTSERRLRTDGRAPVTFSPLSRFWRTSDGWLRTHANYPHHRTRLLSALGISVEDRDDATLAEILASELSGRSAAEVEEAVFAAGGLAVAVRTPQEWAAHPQGEQASRRPLLTTARMDQALPRPLPSPEGNGPLHAVRVLDLTRVLAGPVATRVLALFGADVLRLDAPQLPENADTHADTGAGKRSALLDLSSRSGQSAFEELLSAADVVVTGYRPGALDRFGLAPESLADRRPGLVVGQLSAWGAYGPWHRRRGFDSLVQAASGISLIEGQRDEAGEEIPGALPAQALDHTTGYLLAAAVMRALTEQRRGRPGARLVRLALAQTADWLMNGLTSQGAPAARPACPGNGSGPDHHADPADPEHPARPEDPALWLAETDSPLGRLRYALPPVGYEGSPADWSRPPGVPGGDPAEWW
ncbi:CoA transferase [Streptomyces winkii]|uniref:CoA transferase n=1 Tax=Streptomyces winkii TaxID=3051178 RepID=UPI0028D1844D|nr:CoA transferase [Streptomyces sp. DSM 40971]